MRSEWDVLVVYTDGSHEHFIFQQIDCPTVVHVIKLIEHELLDKGQVSKVRISARPALLSILPKLTEVIK